MRARTSTSLQSWDERRRLTLVVTGEGGSIAMAGLEAVRRRISSALGAACRDDLVDALLDFAIRRRAARPDGVRAR